MAGAARERQMAHLPNSLVITSVQDTGETTAVKQGASHDYATRRKMLWSKQ